MKRKPDPSGLWLLDKPKGITSREYLNLFCKKFQFKDAGHTGTLDPLASGLLIAVTGEACKLQHFWSQRTKEYIATIVLAAWSATDDAEGPIIQNPQARQPKIEEVQTCIQGFLGATLQIPPVYSAIKVQGKRSYHLARQGQNVVLEPREIMIYAIDILNYTFPRITLQVCCSAGTYIRSLARDLGQRLGCGGYIEELRRTAIGHFHIHSAGDIDALQPDSILELESAVAQEPKVCLPPEAWFHIKNGQPVSVPYCRSQGIMLPDPMPLTPIFLWIHGKVVAFSLYQEPYLLTQRLLIARSTEFLPAESHTPSPSSTNG